MTQGSYPKANKNESDIEEFMEEILPEFLEVGQKVVHDEHEQMRKPCEKCGGKTYWVGQALMVDPESGESGDFITYGCIECDARVTKFFPFPKEYAQFWNQSSPTTARKEE